ncbi:hypothetical protein JKI98_09650 [Acinetobacter nectaris]|nr:hypothetical protein [Acinetobacter nectaris]
MYEILISWKEVGKTPITSITVFPEKIELKKINKYIFMLSMINLKQVMQVQAYNSSLVKKKPMS